MRSRARWMNGGPGPGGTRASLCQRRTGGPGPVPRQAFRLDVRVATWRPLACQLRPNPVRSAAFRTASSSRFRCVMALAEGLCLSLSTGDVRTPGSQGCETSTPLRLQPWTPWRTSGCCARSGAGQRDRQAGAAPRVRGCFTAAHGMSTWGDRSATDQHYCTRPTLRREVRNARRMLAALAGCEAAFLYDMPST
jgi:hypothetical protein